MKTEMLIIVLITAGINAYSLDPTIEVEESRKWLNINQYIVQCMEPFDDVTLFDLILKLHPSNLEYKIVDNQYSELDDIVFVVGNDNLVVCIKYVMHSNYYLLQWIRIKTKGVFSIWNIDIGSTRGYLESIFGDALEQSSALKITYRNDIIEEITVYNLE